MADQFGMSFSPSQPGPGQAQNGQRPSPIQQAIQTLSLRIPQRAGASAFTPQTLLDSPGGGGLGGDANSAAILEAIKRMLFGGGSQHFNERGPQMGGGGQGAPAPGGGFDPGVGGGFGPPEAGTTPGGPWMPPHFAPIEGAPADGGATGGGFGPPEASGGGSGGPGGPPFSGVYPGAPATPYDNGAVGRNAGPVPQGGGVFKMSRP